ncbi:MAG: glycosyltransferase family 87 protein [Rhizomicrobium sp.]
MDDEWAGIGKSFLNSKPPVYMANLPRFDVKKFIISLRDGDYLTRSRITAWSVLLVVGFAVSILYLGVTAQGLNDYSGRPLGTDFSNVYAAGVAASRGDATAPFDILRQQKEEQRIFGESTPLYGWHYPPFFLFVAMALAQMPYLLALVVWQLSTLLLYLGSMALLLRKSVTPSLAKDWLWPFLGLGFTAVFVNLTHGHNGFLTASLIAAGIAFLDERPLLAGILFGLLAYKPQFAMVIPLALAASGRWRTFSAAAVTVVALALTVTLVFGMNVWSAFLASTHFTRVVILEQGNAGFYKIQTVFAWVRMWGGSVVLAYSVQVLTDVLIALALMRLWRGNISVGYKGAALCLAALLVTPYSLDYDLMLLAPVIALLVAEGESGRFLPYEATLLATLWLVPILSRSIAHATLLPVAVPAMLLAFGSIYWRHQFGAAGVTLSNVAETELKLGSRRNRYAGF